MQLLNKIILIMQLLNKIKKTKKFIIKLILLASKIKKV